MSAKGKFEKLLSPAQIGRVRLRNRMVKVSQSTGFATADGYVGDMQMSFYEALAEGGVGLIIVEHTFPDYPMGVSGRGRLAISDDKFIPGLSKLVSVIHGHDTPCFVQFGHSGPSQRWGLAPGQSPVSSSALTRSERPQPGYLQARELSIPELGELVVKYRRAAGRARDAGFDGVEIHCGHQYLINSFLSRAWNKRQDAYGGQDLTSRARLAVEIIRAIKEGLGKDFPVGVRINGAEYGFRNGITTEESQGFARILAEAGADFVSVTAWGYGALYDRLFMPEEIRYPEPLVPLARKVKKPGAFVPLAEAVKRVVGVPVIAVGRLDAKLGEWILEKGMADLIGLGRPLFADPALPQKVASGRLEDIAPCTACVECARSELGEATRCRINPALGRENQCVIEPAPRKKKVIVIGGGPAGMESAMVAALRGHEVTLYDSSPRPGGSLPLAALVKGDDVENLMAIVAYFQTQLRKLGVAVNPGKEVDVKLIEDARPDAVIVATGGKLTIPEIPGIQGRNVMSSLALHHRAKVLLRLFGPRFSRWLTRLYLPVGKRVVIVGGQMHGCEVAEFLVKRGRKVTIVEASDQLGEGMPPAKKKKLLWWLAKKGVMMITGVAYDEAVATGLSIITREGDRQTIEADTIVVAVPPVPNTELFEKLKGKVPEVYLIGDAKEPQAILNAVSDGFDIGRTI